ncbi:cation:proton antiporter [Haloactinomyces albus]|uniref:Kef-type K+ transport system membrane component KefB n=1 Tax=Haloactinomyces albus TaxID=1352928 RepID=A0AAE4CLL8_9ACTN|nr:cation:proton antiporter [Haloactinomyces albus]MDR7301974.1 Kef-type K+ transport system membrane component KefB [Haloactinomyces albus]
MHSNLSLATGVVAALVVILVATTLFGVMARRVGQPRVVGEMVAGVVLGPSVLGAFFPQIQSTIFPEDVKDVLYVLSTIGLTFFMFLVGSGVDHSTVDRRSVRRSTSVALGGIIPPFLLGAGAAVVFFDQLATDGSTMPEFVLLLGGALSITAFPMLARMLQDWGLTSTPFGTMTVLAAAVDDAVAWAMLAVIIAVAEAGNPGGATGTIIGAAAFAVFMLTIGRRLLEPVARIVERTGRVAHGQMAIILLVVVASGWFTNMIGIHSIFGGFIAGMSVPNSPVLRQRLQERLTDMNLILFLPVFFVFSGLNTQLAGLGSAELIIPLITIVVLAFAGKYLGCMLVARWNGVSWRDSSAMGGLMNARGLMILIFINVGLGYGIIGDGLFSILVLVAVVTTAAAMPVYSASVRDRSKNGAAESVGEHPGSRPISGVMAGSEAGTAPVEAEETGDEAVEPATTR